MHAVFKHLFCLNAETETKHYLDRSEDVKMVLILLVCVGL